METQNVTLALPRTLLKKLKVVAAKRETSMSALLSQALEDVVRHDDQYGAAMRRAVARARKGYDLRTQGRLEVSREHLHER